MVKLTFKVNFCYIYLYVYGLLLVELGSVQHKFEHTFWHVVSECQRLWQHSNTWPCKDEVRVVPLCYCCWSTLTFLKISLSFIVSQEMLWWIFSWVCLLFLSKARNTNSIDIYGKSIPIGINTCKVLSGCQHSNPWYLDDEASVLQLL